jgi:hypothetical protein
MMSSFLKSTPADGLPTLRIADASVNDLREIREIRRKPEFRSGSTRRGGAACADGAWPGDHPAHGDLNRRKKVAPSAWGERVQRGLERRTAQSGGGNLDHVLNALSANADQKRSGETRNSTT